MWGCLFISGVRLFRSFSSLPHSTNGLLDFGTIPLVGLLNRNVAGLGNPGPIGIDLTCNRDITISINILSFFHSSFYACLCLSIAILVVWWWYCMMYAESLVEVFELLWYEVVPMSETNFLCSLHSICTESLHLFYDGEFAVVIYNTKIMLVINCKDVSPYSPTLFLVFHVILFCQ